MVFSHSVEMYNIVRLSLHFPDMTSSAYLDCTSPFFQFGSLDVSLDVDVYAAGAHGVSKIGSISQQSPSYFKTIHVERMSFVKFPPHERLLDF